MLQVQEMMRVETSERSVDLRRRYALVGWLAGNLVREDVNCTAVVN